MARNQEVNTSLQTLKEDIKGKQLGRLYFFYGEEAFLLNHYLEQVKKILLDPVTESFNYHFFNNETFELRSFADAVENLPMMAEQTLVLVDDVPLFDLDKATKEAMTGILGDIPDYCTVIFCFETAAFKSDKANKPLLGGGLAVNFAKQEGRELVAWVSRHFAVAQKKISNDLCAYLIDITGGTMTALAGEISKICAYSDTDEIKKSDIDAVTEPVLDAVVFQMTDMLAKKDYSGALSKMDTLLKMQQEPLVILGTVGSHLRRLGTARTLLDNGKGVGELMKLCGMSDYPARKMMDAARSFPASFCRTASELVMETDYKIKTSFDDPKRLLETLILRLAQETDRG